MAAASIEVPVQLDSTECWTRLRAARHGVLGTVHEDRGVDAVPVVFAIVDDQIVIPVDTVKPKRSTDLQRLTNVERDSRCALLIDEYDDDWSKLWWVRVHASAQVADQLREPQLSALASRYPQYADRGVIVRALLLTPDAISGWSAG